MVLEGEVAERCAGWAWVRLFECWGRPAPGNFFREIGFGFSKKYGSRERRWCDELDSRIMPAHCCCFLS